MAKDLKNAATEEVTENKKDKNYLEEEVEITLHKDDKNKDDVTVILNGTAIKVPRGKKVKIKRKYANLIEESLRLDAEAVEKREEKAN